jgi:hypothetical protein
MIARAEKVCRDCGERFPATTEYFDRHDGREYGLHSYCKACRRRRHRTECAALRAHPDLRLVARALVAAAILIAERDPAVPGPALHRLWERFDELTPPSRLAEPDPREGSDFVHWLLSDEVGQLCVARNYYRPFSVKGA